MKSKTILCLMGPTASGKTEISCKLMKHFPLEIISVDSAMIYRGMDIGTAKPSKSDLAEYPHHLIDILNPDETYSAAMFRKDINQLCQEIFKRGNIPLLSGGTMMYFNALQQGLSNLPEKNDAIRQQLIQEEADFGLDYLHQQLQKIDPLTAARIHPHDSQRLQRALEVFRITGKPMSDFYESPMADSPFHFINFILMPKNRQWLHDRIKERFLKMLEEGLITEVKKLVERWHITLAHPSMRSVGYRQILLFLQGEYDYATMRDKGIAATRQLAKRQLTWCRHWPQGAFFYADELDCYDKIHAKINEFFMK